ncbi:PREDICTED: uncharacterized protein LOC109209105 [Nicotiana attenuata]|uniref:uncharacterized protein LOC109209105 n=1 Tax=Nicotiana attenuata TaxID=49451 RepID=UPI000904DEB0|nr:PREDICTED: uncharacterized protein LOC109209105 [Nicotiana attenuata]
MGTNILVTSVYAKCDVGLREHLWNNLRDISQNYKLPWYIAGDFNCIIDPSEKQGGNLHRMSKSMPVIQFIMDCDLIDPGFSGSQFTWCNGWSPNRRVWKRLDRVLVNQEWMNNYDSTNVNHLIRTCSDHSPLLTIAKNTLQPTIKYFRFLDFWTNENGFKEVVKQAWDIEVHGSPMWKFHLKLKNTCRCLSHWSKTSIGNIFDNVKDLEKKMDDLEQKTITNNTDINRAELNRINALLIRAYKTEESIWKQKSGIKWFVEGEVNTKFFHSIVKGRRKRLALKKIRLSDGTWIEGDERIANEAISFFQKQFTREHIDSNFSILNCIPKVINEMDNAGLTTIPTMEELKAVVFSMSPSSAPGLDGLSGKFYHSCWDIIKDDLLLMINDFFAGNQIPKAMTHTCLILIPKVDNPQAFNELRPIILGNFSCKIISSLMNQRLSPLMDKLISPYQTGFIKGRSITENIMMTQDMVHNITNSTHGNVVLKVDMAKAYDRVSWEYLYNIMRHFGFNETWIDMIWRLMSNIWYSVNINGNRQGFFNSSRGLRQGDPLSPSLFLIRAELFSKLMESLNNLEFIPFSIDSHGPVISHLCYADDTILFSSAEPESLKIMMEKMETYEKISGQLVNKAKSDFYVNFQDDDIRINRIKQITGYNRCHFPMQYLGCPIYIGRKKVVYFNNMVANIAERLQGWQGKFLTYGGKAVLIKSVLQAIPLHTLSVLHPPKATFSQIEKIFSNFFWGMDGNKNKKHWIAWKDMCFPVEEGGAGFRSLKDTCDAFSAKIW